MSVEPALPMALPIHVDPNARAVAPVAHCRLCKGRIPDDDHGLIAWGLCEPCFDGAEFES